jgi:hypothetical protein
MAWVGPDGAVGVGAVAVIAGTAILATNCDDVPLRVPSQV